MNFKFKNYIYLFLFCGVIFCFSLNVFAQDFTISDCKTATEETLKKIKYPCVDNVKLLDKDNKEDRKTFTKGEMVKFNANVESANELKHVRVFVKKGETLVALIVLKDDGSTKSGDAVAGDNTYSSNWEIPHSFSAQEEYAMVMEAVDERGNKYETEVDEYVKKDKNKIQSIMKNICSYSTLICGNETDFQNCLDYTSKERDVFYFLT